MFTKSSFLVLLTVALSATSALAASDVGSKGAVSRRHHTPSKLSRSVAPSIKFSAKRSLRKKQEAKLARGLKAVNARGTNKLSRRGRLTEDDSEYIEDEERTGGGNRGTSGKEEVDIDRTEGKSNKDLNDEEDTFEGNSQSKTEVDEVYDKGYQGDENKDKLPFEEESDTQDDVVPSGRFQGKKGETEKGDGFGSQDDDEEDLPTQLDDDTLTEGGDSDRTSGNNRITLDEEDEGRVTEDKGRITEEDEGRVPGDKGRVTEEDEGRVTEEDEGRVPGDKGRVTEEDDDEVTGKSSRITRADDSDFDKIARAEGIRRAPSGRWLGRRFK